MYSMPAFSQASIFGGADRPRRVADVGLAAAELLEAAAGAGDADRDPHAWVGLLELLGHGLADREHRARAVELDHRRGGRGFVSAPASLPPPPARGDGQRDDLPRRATGAGGS